ncbi:hypothetical protein BC834DRAFT_1041891 [Gloeopeniophorella convolvens]|nr:hypothetical protein BC834DRAFT_1041891 [Gloeopeniophorella convolvens]
MLSSDSDEYVPLTGHKVEGGDEDFVDIPSRPTGLFPWRRLLACFAVACLSFINLALLPFSLTSKKLTDAQLAALPFPDQDVGLDRAAQTIPIPPRYAYEWPYSAARLSRKAKNTVYGRSTQVYISVEDSTVLRFAADVTSNGSGTCVLSWLPPSAAEAQTANLTMKGDVTDLEVWSVFQPGQADTSDIDLGTLSWGSRPSGAEMLGALNLDAKPNSTTVEFPCEGQSSLVVELRCQRVACHVSLNDPSLRTGFALGRRQA